jgi:alkanesulfonate monooxygenase SsuD/methylene tetrahydromethanopterin reductase-like flavin-dependent oxidoreductase (luciferase family)
MASIGAVAYPSHEELTVFAAAGAVTERIRFVSNVLIAPTRSTAELAKQAATVQQLTGGRLTLGLGVGWRDADYRLTGRDFHRRGRDFDAQLEGLRRAWAGDSLLDGTRAPAPDPGPPGAVPVLIGGTTDATIRRVLEFGVGWTAGGVPPEMAAPFIDKVRSAWRDSDREGAAKIVALAYFSLGADTEQNSRAYLLDYYQPAGNDMAEMVAGNALRSGDAIGDAIQAFESIGVDEFILDPTVSDPTQVERLAEVALT